MYFIDYIWYFIYITLSLFHQTKTLTPWKQIT